MAISGQDGPNKDSNNGTTSQTQITLTKPTNSTDQTEQSVAAPSQTNIATQALTPKELKLQQKAEKQARRAQEKVAKGLPPQPTDLDDRIPSITSNPASRQQQGQAQSNKLQSSAQPQRLNALQQQQQQGTPHRRGSQTLAQRPLIIKPPVVQKEGKKSVPDVGLFGHLYGQARRQTIEGASKDVHPAVLALGFQMSNYVICGSNARCVAMLLAFKEAIKSYTTPPTTSLARHLISHFLSPQIDYLKSHRPISVNMGNAIRWLKDFIIHIDPDVPENDAKSSISDAIDTFVRERITLPDAAIASAAAAKIKDGARIVTFAKSSIVFQTLIYAAKTQEKKFSVTCMDSRPLFEGKNLVRDLVDAGIECRYALLPAAAQVMRDADLVFLGAHAMMANGRLYSRAGTASVAMLAKDKDVPVIVCCESLKFTDRVALDSIVVNEVAPGDELVLDASADINNTTTMLPKEGDAAATAVTSGLNGWKDVQGLQILNLMYDVTPAEYINMVITEYGSLPPSSVPVVYRISTEKDVRT